MEHTQLLFGKGFGALIEERDPSTQSMRKQTVTSLASMFNSEAKKMHDEFERNGMFELKIAALQQPSAPERPKDVIPTPTLDETLPVETQNEEASVEEKEDEEEEDKLSDSFVESIKDFGEK